MTNALLTSRPTTGRPGTLDVPARSPVENLWHSVLYERFRAKPYPLSVFAEGVVPAAAQWTGARRWIAAFRSSGLEAGDRLILALPASPAFVQALIAALWEGLTLALLRPEEDVAAAMDFLDARAAVAMQEMLGVWSPDACGGPEQEQIIPRSPQGASTPDARLILQTSGTSGNATCVALSDANMQAILQSHLPALNLSEARILSLLPWHHAFGLMIELLPALMAGAEILRDTEGGRDTANLLAMARRGDTTHLNATPLVVQRLAASKAGREMLQGLEGGVVGGAPVSAELADFLKTTRLRVGYGQTEASPGLMLGEPGEWQPHLLGRPLGCEVRTDAEGVLHFRGENACMGLWQEGRLHRLSPTRWVDTGDIVRREGETYFFLGRADDLFKLTNGRRVQAGILETRLKEALPAVSEALLFSRDGEALELFLTWKRGAVPVSQEVLQAHLGPLGSRLTQVHLLAASDWKRTPKGELDRRAVTL